MSHKFSFRIDQREFQITISNSELALLKNDNIMDAMAKILNRINIDDSYKIAILNGLEQNSAKMSAIA
ncbi:hypothetical protein TI05_06360 [Achromatium sp. WMS3]|nr:hypothetical protein TI05_06360 [Achromatium sp. WMS3]